MYSLKLVLALPIKKPSLIKSDLKFKILSLFIDPPYNILTLAAFSLLKRVSNQNLIFIIIVSTSPTSATLLFALVLMAQIGSYAMIIFLISSSFTPFKHSFSCENIIFFILKLLAVSFLALTFSPTHKIGFKL